MAVTTATPEQVVAPPKQQSPMAEIWSNLRRSWGGMIGLALILFHIVMALISPYVAPYDPLKFDAKARSDTPTAEHLFGTDKLGRDILSRSMQGGRVTLIVTVLGTAIAVVWGGLFGILIGFLGITRKWVGALGLASLKAMTFSSSNRMSWGSSLSIIRWKIDFSLVILVLAAFLALSTSSVMFYARM